MKIQSSIEYPSAVKLVIHRGFLVGFVIVTLFLTLYYNAAYYWYTPLTGVDWDYVDNTFSAIQLASVLPGSPGQAAGLQDGDRLLAIDGQAVASGNRPLYAPKNAGDIVRYIVERGGRRLTFDVVAGSYSQYPAYLLAMLLLGLPSLLVYALGLLLCLLSAPQDTRARLMGALWLLAGLAVAAAGAGYSGGWFSVDVYLTTLAVGGYVSLAVYLYFPAAAFANHARLTILRAHLALTLLALAAYAWQRITAGEAAPPEALVSGTIIRYIFILTWLLNLALLLKNRFAVRDEQTRRQANIILLGTLLGILPGLLLTALPNLVLGAQFVILPGKVTILALVCIPVSYGYVIGQHKLLKIDWLFNRALALFILMALALLVSASVVGLLSWLHGSAQALLFGGVLCAVLLTVGLHKRIQVWVDHVLYGASYDFRSVTTNLSRRLSQVTNRRSLDNALLEFVQQMHIQKSELLLAQDGRLALPQSGACGVADDEVCQYLLESGLPARAISIWAVASPETAERWAACAWGRVFAPIAYNGALHGVWVLGDRLNGGYYSDQDMENIDTVSQQVALALANLATVEALRGLAQRLVQADEEHRSSVARELHDDILGDLSNIQSQLARLDPALAAQQKNLATRLRQIIKSQRPTSLDSGLALALQTLIDAIAQQPAGNSTNIWLNNLLPKEEAIFLDDESSMAVYRIVQEALSNVLKHAQAEQAIVTLKMDADALVEIEVEDDGIGMEDTQRESPGHFGLIGMRERAAMIGATLTITSVVGEGTSVRVRLKR